MKHKYSVLVAAVVLGLTVSLFAVEKRSGTRAPKLIRLKSNGDTIAELSISEGTAFTIAGLTNELDVKSHRQTAKGNVTIRITHAGGPPVVVTADEIERDY